MSFGIAVVDGRTIIPVNSCRKAVTIVGGRRSTRTDWNGVLVSMIAVNHCRSKRCCRHTAVRSVAVVVALTN